MLNAPSTACFRRVSLLPCLLGLTLLSSAELVTIDSFDAGAAYFTWQPYQSGSQRRVLYKDVETLETLSLAEVTTDAPFKGEGAQRIVIYTTSEDPFPGVGLPDSLATYGNPNYPRGIIEGEWFLRHVAGAGAPANNVPIPNNGTTWVGYWLRTTADNLEVGIMVDDDVSTTPGLTGNNHEISYFVSVIPDGHWHLYEFELANPDTWQDGGFATSPNATGPTGELNDTTVTIDSLVFRGALGIVDVNEVEFFVDEVACNPDGPLSAVISEPTSIEITNVKYTASPASLEITFTSEAGRSYAVETSTTLTPAETLGGWSSAATVEATSAATTYTLPLASGEQSALPTLFVRITQGN